MKIILTGSHGVGKTTLGKQIHDFLNGLSEEKKFTYLREVPVQAHEAGFQINESTSFEAELWMFTKQIEMEMQNPANVILDKGFIDLLAYGEYLFKNDEELISIIRRIALPKIKNYDLVIYLPTGEFAIPYDGLRSMDPIFQSEIDKMILKIMHQNKISYTRIVGTQEERYAKALQLIKGIL